MTRTNHHHFLALPLSLRMVYTMTLVVLGLGYLFAMIHIFSSHAGRDGKASLSVQDIMIAYSGSESDTKLESALKGPMQSMLPPAESHEIIAWVRAGADQAAYEKDVAGIVKNRCLSCHDGSNPHIPNLSDISGVMPLVEKDTGMDIFTLVRVSHIHLFGITFIFFITSIIYTHAHVRPLWFKCIVIVVPFLTIIFDILSWYLTKMWTPFAWVVLISGAFMGLSFAIQAFTSLYQMWLYKMPPDLEESGGQLPVL
ncbi:MAG TPA: hypothetical protein EYH06_01480 [Chromatiales bacterium]|nr:hypothetical protein [Thiotrichales bacterium]HIP67246.1 hypothetical protein [Chromatiales bacterium]